MSGGAVNDLLRYMAGDTPTKPEEIAQLKQQGFIGSRVAEPHTAETQRVLESKAVDYVKFIRDGQLQAANTRANIAVNNPHQNFVPVSLPPTSNYMMPVACGSCRSSLIGAVKAEVAEKAAAVVGEATESVKGVLAGAGDAFDGAANSITDASAQATAAFNVAANAGKAGFGELAETLREIQKNIGDSWNTPGVFAKLKVFWDGELAIINKHLSGDEIIKQIEGIAADAPADGDAAKPAAGDAAKPADGDTAKPADGDAAKPADAPA
jgi:hypothetical protein